MKSNAGFSLFQIGILLTIAGLMVSLTMMDSKGGDAQKRSLTNERLKVIQDAIRVWRAANQRIPCPADGTLPFTSANFGVEAATPGTCTGGTPAANFTGGSHTVGGIIPVRTLGLADEYALDGWGRRFTYIVDAYATKQ